MERNFHNELERGIFSENIIKTEWVETGKLISHIFQRRYETGQPNKDVIAWILRRCPMLISSRI